MTTVCYPLYKGLQKPLEYKGFKGKYIFWGIASIFLGVLSGSIMAALSSSTIAGVTAVITMALGITYTRYKQRSGLADKNQNTGVYIHANKMYLGYEKKQ